MSDIFLSYKRDDEPRAKIIADALEKNGYSVWWDRKIPPGKTFDQFIEEKLDAAKCVIVLWSQQSVSSDWVKEEAYEGFQRRILVPILIDDVKIPLGFRRIQAARLINWQGKLPDPEFDILLESVSEMLSSPIGAKKKETKVQEKGEKKKISEARKVPRWPSFEGTAKFVGTSPSGRVKVHVDPSLGQPAMQNAQDLLNDADRVVTANDKLFGSKGGKVSVIVFALSGATDGTGGADHMGCNYKIGAAIEVCASFGNSARVSALFEITLSECSMGGNLCGLSTGEALSRWCAAMICNNALADFSTAPQWAQNGMQNYVDEIDTDQNPDSTGCGMVFLSWLMSQGYGLDQIAQAMVTLGDSGTLAQLYANLTSDDATKAWPAFRAAVQALPNDVTNDDPFGALIQPT